MFFIILIISQKVQEMLTFDRRLLHHLVYSKSSTFWDITWFSLLQVNQHFQGTCCALLVFCLTLVSCSTYSLTLKMEAPCSSEQYK
jgi:hypothetical protein